FNASGTALAKDMYCALAGDQAPESWRKMFVHNEATASLSFEAMEQFYSDKITSVDEAATHMHLGQGMIQKIKMK
ncbi:unnamed protein product, partial [Amoebophrya sp. A25]